jgi:hypothetical protein
MINHDQLLDQTDTGQALPASPTAGIDWASTDHAVAVVDDRGVEVERFTVPHTTPGLRQLVRRLHRCGVREVAIERPDGPVVDALLEGELGVIVIVPNQLKNLRSRYGSAGNKDDGFDAYVLADTLRTDRARLRPLTRDSEATITLRMTVRARQDLVHARVTMANQLRAHLQTTLPGVIGLFRDIDSAITLRFLTRFPSQDKVDWLSRTRFDAWLRSVGYNHLRNLDRLWEHSTPPHGAHRSAGRCPCTDHPRPGRGTAHPPRADHRAGGPDRRTTPRPPGRGDLHLAAEVRHRTSCPAAGRDRRRPRPLPNSGIPGLPRRRRTLNPPVGQGQGRRVPLGSRQATLRCRHRLRRRLPPHQRLGRRPLRPSASPRPRPPPRRPDPRTRLAPRHLALLARRRRLQPRPTPSIPAPRTTHGLTQGYYCLKARTSAGQVEVLPARLNGVNSQLVPAFEAQHHQLQEATGTIEAQTELAGLGCHRRGQ